MALCCYRCDRPDAGRVGRYWKESSCDSRVLCPAGPGGGGGGGTGDNQGPRAGSPGQDVNWTDAQVEDKAGHCILKTSIYAQKRKIEHRSWKTQGTWRMAYSMVQSGAGVGTSGEKSGKITWLSLLFQKTFAYIFPQWTKENTEGECLPPKEIGTLHENFNWQISIDQNDFKIFKNCESQLCEILHNKFGCISTVDSPNLLALEDHTQSLPVFKKMLPSGVEVSVWKDDLTRHAVDAVVNAANEYLSHKGGLALALVKAGGPEIQEESEIFVERYGAVPTGEVAITGAGRLPCKVIIHAVGPQWTEMYAMRCVNELQRAIVNILKYATTSSPNIKAVAIPAISSGIFGFPLDLCTQTIVGSIRLFFSQNEMAINLKEIHLVSNEEPTVAAFKTASEDILGRNELVSLLSQATRMEYREPREITSEDTYRAEMTKDMFKLGLNNYSGEEEKTKKGLKANSPFISLMGSNKEEMCEAQEWIHRMLTLQKYHIIENSHILYLGKKEHDRLSQLQKSSRVSISEIIVPGKATLEIEGTHADDLIEVVMNIEGMLWEVQEEMANKKEQDLWSLLGQWTDLQPKRQNEMKENTNSMKFREMLPNEVFQDKKKLFGKCGLQVIKVERINNEVLKAVFEAKKKMMKGSTQKEPVSHTLFQQVPHQFCNAVCRVGFQRMYSVPCEPKYGTGIYFTKNLKTLANQIKKTSATDKMIYVFEAEVLTGSFSQGCHSNIVPPPLIPGVIDGHDSVVNSVSNPETFVIFSGTQAMPQYLWTCTQEQVQSQNSSVVQKMGLPFMWSLLHY
ncbi:PREDICTED: poly [ADP-ribose] polymerase 9 [Chrysochloris asiatica]|uniref:Poly [ADP-ribose] polymerase 9 n=1 Tax=Chrysochloris asiatica TaxID=185453 RepID=A0A9B0TXA7_CHRAS|nr:PREDICTED: poly [ADP-ribose] polymerase 9 [Chrysochloris asiatica]